MRERKWLNLVVQEKNVYADNIFWLDEFDSDSTILNECSWIAAWLSYMPISLGRTWLQ